MNKPTTTVGNNLSWLIESRRTNAHELQRATGVPQPTIHRIMTGETADPRTQTLQKLAEYFGVSVSDLRERDFVSHGYLGEPGRSIRDILDESLMSDLTVIPVCKLRLTAGSDRVETEPPDETPGIAVSKMWLKQNWLEPRLLTAFKVTGESMAPTLYAGDVVVINTANTEFADGGVFAVNFEGELMIRRLERDSGEWWLKADNPDQRKYGRKAWNGDFTILLGRAVLRESCHF